MSDDLYVLSQYTLPPLSACAPQTNMWGYSHINFFAPMSRFAAGGAGPVAAAREFKEMVKK